LKSVVEGESGSYLPYFPLLEQLKKQPVNVCNFM